jgi:HlyD family secretion protein
MNPRLPIGWGVVWVPVIVAAALFLPGCSRRAPASPGHLRASGNIEVTEAEVSFKIAGRVETREVDEGEAVTAGQTIARLEQADLEQERALRQAEVDLAAAVLAEAEAGSRPEEIAAAKATWDYARAEAERATLDFARAKELFAANIATAREFEAAEASWKASQAKVRETQERLTLLELGPRREQIDQARARLQQAKQALALATTRLSYATVMAPTDGVVLSKNVEPGEYVAPGTPVVTVGDLAHPWLWAYINETDLGRVRLGQRVSVRTDTYPDKTYDGTVSFISSQAEFTPKNVQTYQERVKLVYRLKITLTNPHGELKPGMPADAEIDLANGAAPEEPSPRP